MAIVVSNIKFYKDKEMSERNLQSRIMQHLMQNNIRIRHEVHERVFYVECPVCSGDGKIDYITGRCTCRHCKLDDHFDATAILYGDLFPYSYTEKEVMGMMPNIRWTRGKGKFYTICPECARKRRSSTWMSEQDDLTLVVSPENNLGHCNICGYRRAFTHIADDLEKIIQQDKTKRAAKRETVTFNPPMTIENLVIENPNMGIRDITFYADEVAIHRETPIMDRIMENMRKKVEAGEGVIFQSTPPRHDYMYGGIVKHKFPHLKSVLAESGSMTLKLPKLPRLYGKTPIINFPIQTENAKMMRMDFAGIETKVAAAFGMAGKQAGEMMKQFVSSFDRLKIEKYLKGKWIMFDSVTGENSKISIACVAAFNPNELGDMVSREHPFMYTKGEKPVPKQWKEPKYICGLSEKENLKRINRSKADFERNQAKLKEKQDNFDYHNNCVHVFVHQSLMHKAVTLGMNPESCLTEGKKWYVTSSGNWYCELDGVANGEVGKVRKFWKEVNAAKWNDGTGKLDVQLNYEEL